MAKAHKIPLPVAIPSAGESAEIPGMGDFRLASIAINDHDIEMSLEYEDQKIDLIFENPDAISGFMAPEIAYIDNIHIHNISGIDQSEIEIRKYFSNGSAYDVDNIVFSLTSRDVKLLMVRIVGISGVVMHILCEKVSMFKSLRVQAPLSMQEQEHLKRREEEIKSMLRSVMVEHPSDKNQIFEKIKSANKKRQGNI